MLILTFQKREVVSKILKGEYTVDLSKSPFAYSSVRFTKAYSIIINRLKKKNPYMSYGEGCLWGWVANPDESMVKNYLNKGYVAMYIDVDRTKCVLSDYDRYSDYALEESDDSRFVLEAANKVTTSVQCSFTTEAIRGIRGVFCCNDMLLYPDISRCYYSMMLLRNIKGNSREYYRWNKLKIDSYLRKLMFVTKQVLSEECKSEYVNSI